MESHQSVVLPLKNISVVMAEPERQKSDFVKRNSGRVAGEIAAHKKEGGGDSEGFVGVLEVYIHQARDIHNICIYHKQDVYAKIYLTSNPETAVSTQTVNGGGKSPVFSEKLWLNVRDFDASLKCEIWMLSRVRNYLEDQLLGIASVPLSDILAGDCKQDGEFSLSSNDLFDSPAGFVHLSFSYCGDTPDVLAITPRTSLSANAALQDTVIPDSVPNDYEKIEFPDPQVVNENDLMVSQYFAMPCTSMDSQISERLAANSESETYPSLSLGVKVVESFSEASPNSIEVTKTETPVSSVSTNGSPSQSYSDTSGAVKSPNQELASPLKEQSDSSGGLQSSTFSVNIEPEQTVVQQDIVDMYMKSMQQFTESLAKMKLPMDFGNGNGNGNGTSTSDSGNSNGSSDQKSQTPKSTGSRVFYGSRAFF